MRELINRIARLERRALPVEGVFAIIQYDSTSGQYIAVEMKIQGCIPPPGQAESVAAMVHNFNNPQPQRVLADLIAEAEVLS